MKLVFISHPCTTYGDAFENRLAAREYEDKYRQLGYHVLNPLDVTHSQSDYTEAMRLSYELLQICDVIILCGRWNKSRGCCAQAEWARQLNLEIVKEE